MYVCQFKLHFRSSELCQSEILIPEVVSQHLIGRSHTKGRCYQQLLPVLQPHLPHSTSGTHTGSQPRPLWLCKYRTPVQSPTADPHQHMHSRGQPPHPCSLLSPCMPCAQWPITSLRCSAHARGETVQQPQEYMCTARTPQLLVGPDLALSSVTGLHHWAHQHLAPSTVHLYTPGLTPNTSLHHHMPVVRTSSHSGACEQLHSHSCRLAHSWPWPLLLALAPITTCVFAAGLCRYIGTCSWPLETSVCIPPALANTVICQVPGSRCCRCC